MSSTDPLTVILISDFVTFVLSAGVSLISFAVKWGSLKEQVQSLENNMARKDEVQIIGRDVAEIKGMFKLTLKE